MNISIMQHYHRREYEINFYRETMIDANTAGRRFNYLRWPFLEIDDPAIEKFLLSSHFLFPHVSLSLSSLRSPLMFFIFRYQANRPLGWEFYGISKFALLTKRDISKEEMTERIPEFYYPFPPLAPNFYW